jgi:hypothetical protein
VPREVPREALAQLRARPAFQYERGEARGESFWARVWQWLADRVLEPIFVTVPDGVIRAVATLVFLASVVFALVKLFGGRVQGGLARAARAGSLEEALVERGIEGVDLHAWLAAARASGAHREVVRIHFLLGLQALAASGAIAWAPEKTNRTYLGEVRGSPAEAPFARFSQLFDRAWYGLERIGPQDADSAARLAAELGANPPAGGRP